MNFHFVENNAIDDVSRRKIRSVVMRGKNTGRKPLRVPKKPRAKLASRPISMKNLSLSSTPSNCETDIEIVSIPKPFGDALAYFTFPVQLNGHMKYLIRQCA